MAENTGEQVQGQGSNVRVTNMQQLICETMNKVDENNQKLDIKEHINENLKNTLDKIMQNLMSKKI